MDDKEVQKLTDINSPFYNDFNPTKPLKASNAIYDQIRTKILASELRPGDRLPSERDLMELFQRSRPTIREALRMLENKGYITIIRGKGTFINKPSINEIGRTLNNLVRRKYISLEDVLDVRHSCETHTIALASQNRVDEDIHNMIEILDNAQLVINDFQTYMSYGEKFNNAIFKAAHNEMFYLVSRITSAFSHDKLTEQALVLSDEKKASMSNKINEQHRNILDAIINQNSATAMQLNDEHIEFVAQSMFSDI